MVQQIVLQSSLLVMTAMMVQIHVGVAPDIAASIVIYVIGGAILLTSVTELVNLIRKSVNRCCGKEHVSDEQNNNPTQFTSQTVVPLEMTESIEENKGTDVDM